MWGDGGYITPVSLGEGLPGAPPDQEGSLLPQSRRIRLSVAHILIAAVTLALLAAAVLVEVKPAKAVGAFAVGDVFAAKGGGEVERYSNTGTLLDTLNTTAGGSFQTGMCFDPTGNLYTTDFSAGSITKFDSSGNVLAATWATGLGSPESCVRNAAGHFFISQVGGGGIREVDAAGATVATYLAGRTDWIDLASDQCTMFISDESATIKRWNVCTNLAMANFATLTGSCTGLRVRAALGDLLVACGDRVYHLDSLGAQLPSYMGVPSFGAAQSDLFALNLDPDATTFWTGSIGSNNVFRVNIATGALVNTFTVVTSGGLFGLAVFGEITAAQPSPSPSPVASVAAASPSPTGPTLPLAGSQTPTGGPGTGLVAAVLGCAAVCLGGLGVFRLARRRRPATG